MQAHIHHKGGASIDQQGRPWRPAVKLSQTPAIFEQIDGRDLDAGFVQKDNDDVADGYHLAGGAAFQADPEIAL
jgi:hypothetical protein